MTMNRKLISSEVNI